MLAENEIGDWLGRETSGAEIAEAAVVLPLLFMLLFGIMWFARAFNIYTTINRAAREGALAAAAHNCATCGNTRRDRSLHSDQRGESDSDRVPS